MHVDACDYRPHPADGEINAQREGRSQAFIPRLGWPDCKASVLCAKPRCLLMERIANGGISVVATVLWEEVLDRWFPIGPLPQASGAEGCWCRKNSSPSVLLCVGCRQVPSGLLTIPRQPFGLAWVTCMSSASQQPCGGVSQGRDCLCPRCFGSAKGGGAAEGCSISRPPDLLPVPQLRHPWGLLQRPKLG